MVGKHGAELFTASILGALVPNSALGGNMNVTIINNSNSQVQTRPAADGNGIEVLIDAVKHSIGHDIAYAPAR